MSETIGTPRLSLNRVSCRYGTFTAVSDLDLRIETGEFVSLLGPSGCGKTTTLRMIAGFVRPTGGEIVLDGEVISSAANSLPPEKRGMSMIFQSYAIWPHMTVAENVAFGLKLRKMDRSTIREKVTAVLDAVRLGALADRYPAELSGGQQQRVALARAVVVRPRVLLLDEPLSNLDANLREEMRSEIRRLHDAFGFTTVYVTHDQSEAMVTSDRIAVMNGGRIEQIDAPYLLYTRPRTKFVASFIGRTNILEGRHLDGAIRFDGFTVPAGIVETALPGPAGEAAYALRPQCITLTRTPPQGDGSPSVAARLVERAFLGETWDYLVAPVGGETRIRVAATPSSVFEVGEDLWLGFDPRQLVAIAP
jgi:ABC-type Fe3+/spermidine/putrescine transport system ATPase subunit